MPTIRELFHEMGNLHNKISVTAGVIKGELQQKFKDIPLPPETEKLVNRLSELEQHAVEAGKTLNQLNDIIYDVIDPDTGKPRKD